MTNTVVNINHNISSELLSFYLSTGNIKFFHVEHKEQQNSNQNIIEISKSNPNTKKVVVDLANAGFMAYVLRDGITSFVHHSVIRNLWLPVKNKEYSISADNVVYLYEDADISINKHLVVMFYPVAPNPNSASLNRYFPSNFKTLSNYLSKNYSILRIADVGGISGSFYMNTNFNKSNERNIQNLIKDVAEKNGIDRNNIIMYGASKGGTGALYHGILGGYALVSIDPIVDDEHYINLGDLHNVNGIFPDSKREKFSDLLLPEKIMSKITIITSHNSEQYPYITLATDKIKDHICLFNNISPKIKTHVDVAPNSIHAILSALNSFSFGIPHTAGVYNIS